MNQDQIAGSWKKLKGKVKEQWGKLTDDDITQLEGHQDQLVGKIQERYGVAKEDAEKQIESFRTTNKDLWSN
ncbi:CsbD family protein [Dongia mobilis]|uniref:CsbD family protein n=1 Tax=Dongia sp. TaxID=1977262 RepID=UPI0026F134CA